MNDTASHVVIIGAGHAGGTVVATLRQYGWKGPITLIGAEPVPPYQRPPLSKAWLKREADASSLALRAAAFYPANAIELHLATHATSIDPENRSVALASGERLNYDQLILATGARPRMLPIPGHDLAGVLALRSVADADLLQAALTPGSRLVVSGGGYIGLEVAASARALGVAVTVVEREARVLARVASQPLSEFFTRTHEANDVRILCGASIAAIDGDASTVTIDGTAGRVAGVRLADGTSLPCDTVLIGVGAAPDDALARAAGLTCDDGIIVDLAARTSDERIYAIGDCTRRPLPLYGRSFRLESVPNALEQAKQAAADLCGRPPPAPEVPWFWSDQYDIRLQIAGLPFDVDDIVLRGDPAGGKFAAFHLAADGAIQAVEAVNSPAEFMAGRIMIGRRKRTTATLLRDMSRSMQELAA
jgi:3-phenylpropionate/trans-cinnamate dioxygenase ferredoxin reductase component